MNNILVLGGTGFVGRDVCEKLVERTGGGADGTIAVASRHPSRGGDLWTLPTLEVLQCNVMDDAQLRHALHGRDAVVNLVGILHGSDAEFQRVHVDLPRRLAQACAAANVPRVVHVSALGASASAPSKYLRSKAAGEAALRQPGLAVTVLRPSVIFGEHDHFINSFATLAHVFPVLPLACADARFQPVWVEDVALAVSRALDIDPPHDEVIECVGPTVYTLKELVQLASRWTGRPRAVVPLPGPLARAQAMFMEMMPGEPLLSRDNIESMKVPSVASGQFPGLERLGIAPRSMESVMPAILSHKAGPERLEPWRALARRR